MNHVDIFEFLFGARIVIAFACWWFRVDHDADDDDGDDCHYYYGADDDSALPTFDIHGKFF